MTKNCKNNHRIRNYHKKRSRGMILPTHAEKLLEHYNKNPHLSQKQLQSWYEDQFNSNISQSTISRVVNKKFKRDRINERGPPKSKGRSADYPALEDKLFLWIQEMDHLGLTFKRIRIEAQCLFQQLYPGENMPSFSPGWYQGFRTRYRIHERRFHGDAETIPEATLDEHRKKYKETLLAFRPGDIYNMDETAHWWDQFPDRGIAAQKHHGIKKTKNRFTVVFCCNRTGEDKMKVWIIGRRETHVSFGKENENLLCIDCEWKWNPKGWMNTDLMIEWLLEFDRHVSSRGKNKVLLLMDNHSAHKKAVRLLEARQGIPHVHVEFLPPNTTSTLQPLDQGIIRSFKSKYMDYFINDAVSKAKKRQHPGEKLPQLPLVQALRWTVFAWMNVTQTTISNCWNHTGYCELLPSASRGTNVASTDELVGPSQLIILRDAEVIVEDDSGSETTANTTDDSDIEIVEEAYTQQSGNNIAEEDAGRNQKIARLHRMGIIEDPVRWDEFLDEFEPEESEPEDEADERSTGSVSTENSTEEPDNDVEYKPKVSHHAMVRILEKALEYLNENEWDRAELLYPKRMLARVKRRIKATDEQPTVDQFFPRT